MLYRTGIRFVACRFLKKNNDNLDGSEMGPLNTGKKMVRVSKIIFLAYNVVKNKEIN